MAYMARGTAMALNGNGLVTVLEPVIDTIVATPNGRKHAKPERDFVLVCKDSMYVCSKTQFPALYWNWNYVGNEKLVEV